ASAAGVEGLSEVGSGSPLVERPCRSLARGGFARSAPRPGPTGARTGNRTARDICEVVGSQSHSNTFAVLGGTLRPGRGELCHTVGSRAHSNHFAELGGPGAAGRGPGAVGRGPRGRFPLVTSAWSLLGDPTPPASSRASHTLLA